MFNFSFDVKMNFNQISCVFFDNRYIMNFQNLWMASHVINTYQPIK